MFAGFTQHKISARVSEINFRRAGNGPPLLLLHGYPQTHVLWHRMAPALAKRFTVIAADLRGYGDSSKPATDPTHMAYSKRTMAADMVAVMKSLGFARFAVAGHDRGGRVAYRMALDHPAAVSKLAVLDIVTTHTMWTKMDKALATSSYHWLFLMQPDGLPETMIGKDPAYYLRETLRRWARPGFNFAPEAMTEYIRCFSDPACIHAACEDYRAGGTVDFEHDQQDFGKKQITCPVLALWGARGIARRSDDPLAAWRPWTTDLRGQMINDCGHFLPEEAPDETSRGLGEIPVNDAPPAEPTSFRMGLMRRLRAYFFAGILITAPISITIYIAWIVIGFIDARVAGLLPGPSLNTYLPFDIPGIGLVIVVVGLTLIGWITAGILGRLFLRLSEAILNRMPVVRSVYSWMKQIFETVFHERGTPFRDVVLVEFPRAGLWRIGFVTGRTPGKIQDVVEGGLLNVMLPNTPNAATGFLVFVPPADVIRLDLTPEEALKLLVSGGIATPPERPAIVQPDRTNLTAASRSNR